MKNLIEDNGGIVYDVFECYSCQIKPEDCCEAPTYFHSGWVYSERWISDSIQKGEFLEWSNYLLGFIQNSKWKSIPKGKAAYTIVEIL